LALTKFWDPADAAVTDATDLTGSTPRQLSNDQGLFQIISNGLASQVTNVETAIQALMGGDALYFDIAGSGTTDGSGDLAIDLSTTFSAVKWAIILPRGTTFEHLQLQSISTATVTYRSFDAAGAARATAATSYLMLVGGTPAVGA